MGDSKGSGVDIGLLFLRLALGGVMMAHGIKKLIGPGVEGFSGFLANLGLPQPYWMAIAAISAEIGGGLLVVLGLFAPLGALGIFITVAVAAWTVHLQHGFWLVERAAADIKQGDPIPNGVEYTVVLAAMALCIVFAGPGRIRVPVGKRH